VERSDSKASSCFWINAVSSVILSFSAAKSCSRRVDASDYEFTLKLRFDGLRASSSGWMSSGCRFSTTCASIASASVSLTIRTGTLASSATLAALKRRAPATTSYLLCSNSLTRRGASTPCVLKLAASSSMLFSSNRFEGCWRIPPAR